MKTWIKGLWCEIRGHKTTIAQCPVTGIKARKCDKCGVDHGKSKGSSFN
jgi:hypothetical protein